MVLQSKVRADFPAQAVRLPLRTSEDSTDLGLLAWPLGKLGSRVPGAGQSQICTSPQVRGWGERRRS